MTDPAPITVIGGYLGAGKTTLVNRLLTDPGNRRLGVIVNDFGALGIDAAILAEAAGGDVVSLPNGCVCCSLGADLAAALDRLMELPQRPDHIVVEVSGVADPAATAAWGTHERFSHGGVIVVADAVAVRQQASDRYVGTEVRRQLSGADLIVLSKPDLVSQDELQDVGNWVDGQSGGAPRVTASHGQMPRELLLGQTGVAAKDTASNDHGAEYAQWSWTSAQPITSDSLAQFVAGLPPEVLRLKGRVLVTDQSGHMEVQVVGRHREIRPRVGRDLAESEIVAIARSAELSLDAPQSG